MELQVRSEQVWKMVSMLHPAREASGCLLLARRLESWAMASLILSHLLLLEQERQSTLRLKKRATAHPPSSHPLARRSPAGSRLRPLDHSP